MKNKHNFFFPNLEKYKGYLEARVCNSIKSHPKIRKLEITQNTSYKSEMNSIAENKTIEFFKSLDGRFEIYLFFIYF